MQVSDASARSSFGNSARLRVAAVLTAVVVLCCQSPLLVRADDTTGGGTQHPSCADKIDFRQGLKEHSKPIVERTTFRGSCRPGHSRVKYNVTRVVGKGITFTIGGVDTSGRSICKAPSKGGSSIKLSDYPIDFVGYPPFPRFLIQFFDPKTGKFIDVKQINGQQAKRIDNCGLYRYVITGTGGK